MINLCKLNLHKAIPSKLWNDGHYFSECERCHVPMIRTPEQPWKPVPNNMRVVWRERTGDDIIWPTHIL